MDIPSTSLPPHPLQPLWLAIFVLTGFLYGMASLNAEHLYATAFSAPDPSDAVAKLRRLWTDYEPQMQAYLDRALNPSAAPSYGVKGNP